MAQLELDERGLLVSCRSCGQKNRMAFERLDASVRCGRCKQALQAPATPLEASSTADFERLIARSTVPVVVDYWAPWCGPCRMVAPELEKVAARSAGRWLVVKVNTDALSDLGERFRIQSIPTMAVFAAGREVGRTAGARPASDIEAFVRQTLGRA
ncbi:MAG: thioredoxin [Vicinamibacterales bacterium]